MDDIIRCQDDVVSKLPYPPQGLPDYFFIQILTKDIFGAISNHTVWQPALIEQNMANDSNR